MAKETCGSQAESPSLPPSSLILMKRWGSRMLPKRENMVPNASSICLRGSELISQRLLDSLFSAISKGVSKTETEIN